MCLKSLHLALWRICFCAVHDKSNYKREMYVSSEIKRDLTPRALSTSSLVCTRVLQNTEKSNSSHISLQCQAEQDRRSRGPAAGWQGPPRPPAPFLPYLIPAALPPFAPASQRASWPSHPPDTPLPQASSADSPQHRASPRCFFASHLFSDIIFEIKNAAGLPAPALPVRFHNLFPTIIICWKKWTNKKSVNQASYKTKT